MKTLAAIVLAGLLSLLTDRLFLRVLFREAFESYPEIWWPGIRDGETRLAVVLSSILGLLLTAGVVVLCEISGCTTAWAGAGIGMIVFTTGPFAVLMCNMLYVKADVWVLVANNLAYLSRALIAGTVAGTIVPLA